MNSYSAPSAAQDQYRSIHIRTVRSLVRGMQTFTDDVWPGFMTSTGMNLRRLKTGPTTTSTKKLLPGSCSQGYCHSPGASMFRPHPAQSPPFPACQPQSSPVYDHWPAQTVYSHRRYRLALHRNHADAKQPARTWRQRC